MAKAYAILLLAVLMSSTARTGRSQWPAPCLWKARCPPQQQAKPESADASVTQRRTDSLPIVVRISPTQIQQLIAAQKADNHEQKSSGERGMILVTLLLVVVTGGLWKATRDLVRGAEITAERQLRAYLTRGGRVEGFTIKTPQGIILEFRAPIRNDGQTPAYEVIAEGRMAVFPVPLPADADFSLPPRTGEEEWSAGPLGPHQTIWPNFDSPPLSPQELAAVQLGRLKRLYMFGKITYKDIFQKNRHTEFREWARWEPDGKPITLPTETGNKSD